ncbi:magnesium transporter CorA family protein [Lactobacillus johnsonii]|uniref:Mg2+ and Co2+ transporter n=1 Tax=Lactobacillus johnsonii TaxID=33959 RepID=A0A9X0J5B3_LACJH|nr:magnesium transporter CorA family protein [Lactobacillus johnsonii]KXN75250.1 Mg2+ and Co2+ transporter [Lactobacillus johnsonii]
MLTMYNNQGQLISHDLLSAKLIILVQPTAAELNHLEKTINCDTHIFTKQTSATEVSHFNALPDCKLKGAHIFVSFNLDPKQSEIEDSLYPTIAIFNSQHLILILQKSPTSIFQDKTSITKLSVEVLLIKQLLYQNYQFNKELDNIKQAIDELDHAARTSTKTQSLKQATDLMKTLVYFNHTMNDQTTSINSLTKFFKEQHLADSILIIDLILSQQRITKQIKVYRDLLESINGLFSAMMDNHLNNLMKYLDSVALIISIPALISSIWGMNVGGLPGKENKFGFLWVLLFGLALAIISSFFLRRKNYLK